MLATTWIQSNLQVVANLSSHQGGVLTELSSVKDLLADTRPSGRKHCSVSALLQLFGILLPPSLPLLAVLLHAQQIGTRSVLCSRLCSGCTFASTAQSVSSLSLSLSLSPSLPPSLPLPPPLSFSVSLLIHPYRHTNERETCERAQTSHARSRSQATGPGTSWLGLVKRFSFTSQPPHASAKRPFGSRPRTTNVAMRTLLDCERKSEGRSTNARGQDGAWCCERSGYSAGPFHAASFSHPWSLYWISH